MPKSKLKKRRLVKKVDKPTKAEPKPKKLKKKIKNPEPDSESIETLLEPYTKDQLIDFLVDAAVKTPSIYAKINETADRDVSHRKIFVHGLSWEATNETLVSAFELYGEIEDCKVVIDRVTGKAKGFGFVIFKSRQGANKALKESKKKIGNRMVSCQLASIGPPVIADTASRKIYVTNVPHNVDALKLRQFFEKFGEIEAGPLGFDVQTGKCKGYALFVYKNVEGVKKVLEEPNKIFDGNQLHCQMATDGKNSKSNANASVTTAMQPVPQVLAAVAAQNMALLGQQSTLNPLLGQQLGLNPLYGGLYANPSSGLFSPLLSQGAIGTNQIGHIGIGLGSYGGAMAGSGMGSLGGSQSILGPYGTSTFPGALGLQHAYPDTQLGQTSTSKAPGAFSGYPSYKWYDFSYDYLIVFFSYESNFTVLCLFDCLHIEFGVLEFFFFYIVYISMLSMVRFSEGFFCNMTH